MFVMHIMLIVHLFHSFLLYSLVLNTTNLHAHMCEKRRDAYRVLVGTPGGKRHFGKSSCRRESNIKINHKSVEIVSVGSSGCGRGPVLHSCKQRNKFFFIFVVLCIFSLFY